MTESLPAAIFDADAAIRAVAAARDREAFAALFRHFAPRLKGFFMRMGDAPALAEDIAQDAMIALWNKAHYFDPARASAATWIYTIARNIRIDRLRRQRASSAPDDILLAVPEPMPSDHVLLKEREAKIRSALDLLPAEQQRVIRLSFFDDKSHSEIAAFLGIPLGTVKSRVRLAMEALRRKVEELR